jgi:uncharacterized protein
VGSDARSLAVRAGSANRVALPRAGVASAAPATLEISLRASLTALPRPVLLAAALLLAPAGLALAAPAALAQEPATIAADGAGVVRVAPDQARFQVSVRRTARTAAVARTDVRRRVDRVVRALAARGVPRDAIATEYAAIERERVRTGRPRKVRIRYRAQTSLTVLTDQVNRLGRLFDAVAAAGGDVSGPEFSFADPSRGTAEAARAALADARRRADDAAAALGLRVGAVVSVDLDPEGQGFEGAGSSAGGGASGRRTAILPGLRDVVAHVRVTYALLPAA